MTTNGGAHHVGNDTDPDVDLDQIVAGLRGGDLSFVFVLATRFGARIVAHAGPSEPHGADRVVHEVALVLAELASSPDGADRRSEDLLDAAIERACLTLAAQWVDTAGTGRRSDERSV